MNSTILAAVLCNYASSALLHPARVPDSIRAATLRAAYDSPGVTEMGLLDSRARDITVAVSSEAKS